MLLVLAFCSLSLILLLQHELWQDEWQAWLIAAESSSLPDLFRNLRYEGHPGLWHLGLFLISRVTPNPLGMQLLHLVLITCSVYLFLQYSPFSRLQKILFLFGYFPFYEYAVISRNYVLGVLGLFAFCALFCLPPPRKYLLLAVVLFLLCQTSVYGLMIAIVLGMIIAWTAARDQAVRTWKAVAASLLVLGGICLSLIQIAPPDDSGFAEGWRFAAELSHLVETLATVWQSYFPIPTATYHFWGTNLIPDPRWQSLLSVILVVFGLLLFIQQPVPLFLYAVGTMGILAFTYLKYPGSLRHHGHLFLLLVASLWLSSVYPQKRNFSSFVQTISDFCQANRNRVFSVLLVAHLLAGVTAASLDLWFPFSAGKDTARFIQHHRLDQMIILGHADDAASTVAGYLGRPLYYPASRRWGSFIVWNQGRKTALKTEELLHQAAELSHQQQQDVLLLLNYELPLGELPIILIQKFTHSMLPAENYYVYLMPRPQPKRWNK